MRLIGIVGHNVWRRKARSALTCSGIALAVATTLALVGFSSGLEQSTLECYEGRAADLVVAHAGVTQRLTSSIDERIGPRIAALPGVRAVNPCQRDMVSLGEGSLVGIPVQGWPADGLAMQSLVVAEGRRLGAGDHGGVMLGQSLAATLGKRVGEEVEIELQKFRLVGIFAGLNVYENMSVVTLLDDLQRLMDRAGQVNEFQVTLAPDLAGQPTRVGVVRAAIEALADPEGHHLGLSALPARRFAQTGAELGLARAMAWGTSLIAVSIGGFGLLNTMLMSVLERVAEIGIFRALGWRESLVARMILLEALLLSAVGAAAGVAGGWLLVRGIMYTGWLGGLLRPELSWTVLATGVSVAVLIGGLGGLYPAKRAAKLSVVEALRYE